MPVIYIDILFALNLWVDFLLLLITARLIRRPVRRWRLLLAAAVGAVLACLLFLVNFPWPVSLLLRPGGALLMVAVGFPRAGMKHLCLTALSFCLCSAVFAGAVMAVWLIIRPAGLYVVDGVAYYDISPLVLALLTGATYGVLCIADAVSSRRVRQNTIYSLHLRTGDSRVCLACMFDSGHHLTEPFSGHSVIVADMDAVLPVCPAAVPDWLCGDCRNVSADVSASLRIIPYRTVGGKGLLPAFRPDEAVLSDARGRSCTLDGVYIAVADGLQCGDCRAIIGRELVQLLT